MKFATLTALAVISSVGYAFAGGGDSRPGAAAKFGRRWTQMNTDLTAPTRTRVHQQTR